jgi:hypothetical protein
MAKCEGFKNFKEASEWKLSASRRRREWASRCLSHGETHPHTTSE